MSDAQRERLLELPKTGADTGMGKLLRRFWQPVTRSESVAPGKAKPVKIFGEELTVYRGLSGKPYVIGGRCPHRRTALHTGSVEGETLRCMYHGWKFAGTGACLERPAERDTGNVKTAGYPTHEYCGLIFAYMGDGPVPAFDLPRKDPFERPDTLLFVREEVWQCNWLQHVENSMDPVHVSFVHHWGALGPFGETVAATVPELECFETDAGVRLIATRSAQSRRVSNWTFPNNNHIRLPGVQPDDPWVDVTLWVVANDDNTATRFQIYAIPSTTPEVDRRITEYFERHGPYDPADHHDEIFAGKLPSDTFLELTSVQDYVALVGQGTIVDRTQELLGRSDMIIAFLRRIFWREIELIQDGKPTKAWRRLEQTPDMPRQVRETADA